MSNKLFSSASYADTKPHYHILDGLRGAAALMVVWYHVFEGFAFAEGSAIDVFNHGYLAVDFFFIFHGGILYPACGNALLPASPYQAAQGEGEDGCRA